MVSGLGYRGLGSGVGCSHVQKVVVAQGWGHGLIGYSDIVGGNCGVIGCNGSVN